MSDGDPRRGFAFYLRVWAILLGLTLIMIAVDRADLRFGFLAAALLAAMLIKASLIAGYFMHLRFEGRLLVWSVVTGLFGLGLILYLLLIPDGLRIHDMVSGP